MLSIAQLIATQMAAEFVLLMLFLLGTWALAWRLFDGESAWMTLGAAACSPFVLFMAGSYLSHLPTTVAVIGVNLSLLNSADANSRRKTIVWGALAGLCAGIAFQCRPLTAVLAVGATVLMMALIFWRRPRPFLIASVAAIPPGLLVASLFLLWNKATTGAYLTTGYHILQPGIGGHRHLGAGNGFFVMSTWLRNIPLYLRHLNSEVWRGFTPDWLWPMLGLAICGRQLKAYALTIALFLFIASHAFYHYFDLYFGPRFSFAVKPWFFVLTGAGLAAMVSLLKYPATKWLAGAGLVVAAANGTFVLFHSIPYFYSYYAANYSGNSHALVVEVQEKTPKDSVILVPDAGVNQFANFFNQNAIDLSESHPLFIRVNAKDVQNLQECLQRYPRKHQWVINFKFDPLDGRNLYPDRLSLRYFELLELEEQRR